MAHQYTSPLRPLDIGYAAKLGGVEIDWDATDIGPVVTEQIKTRRYGFKSELPASVVAALELEKVGP